MKKLLCGLLCVFLCSCTLGYTTYRSGKREYAFRLMQMPILADHGSAQSTVGIGFSLRFTDHSGAVTPKLDLGYFRHATGLTPILYEEKKRLGSMAIVTAADVTGDGIKDEISFGEATQYESFPVKAAPSMFEMVIGELQGMQATATEAEKAKYQATIDFIKNIMGGS